MIGMVNDRTWTLLTRKLAGEASATELDELALLLSEQPLVDADVQKISAWWATNPETDVDFLEATYLQHIERMKEKGLSLYHNDSADAQPTLNSLSRRKLSSLKIGIAGALVMVAVTFGLFLAFGKKSFSARQAAVQSSASIEAGHGARNKVLLPDGSNVWLNSGSKLVYSKNFKTGSREVYLTGEGFFDVVKNPDRPFIIHTSKMDVRVLGTRFNVKAYENGSTTETSLIRGSVEVFLKSRPKEKYLLKPNEKLVFQNNPGYKAEKTKTPGKLKESPEVEIKELTYIKGSNVDIETSWVNNILSFEDESFLDVSRKMERWYAVTFDFKNKKWEKQFLSGSFENETLEQAMAALKYSNGFDYRIKDNVITIY
jgi:transmembrane sensor